MVALMVITGCRSEVSLHIHYIPGIVPGSENIFRAAKIAVFPATGALASGKIDAGKTYAADGGVKTATVTNAGKIFTLAIVSALAGAGLEPLPAESESPDSTPPEDVDFILTYELEQFDVVKRFGSSQTVHGQYFTMHAAARAKFVLKNRRGKVLYSGEIVGIEDEPPAPSGNEVFLPLEAEPGESLSVAMSRTAGLLMIDPKFRIAFVAR